MNKGELYNVYLDGVMMTLCVLGSYIEEISGEEVVILALISPDNMLHMPLYDFNLLFSGRKTLH